MTDHIFDFAIGSRCRLNELGIARSPRSKRTTSTIVASGRSSVRVLFDGSAAAVKLHTRSTLNQSLPPSSTHQQRSGRGTSRIGRARGATVARPRTTAFCVKHSPCRCTPRASRPVEFSMHIPRPSSKIGGNFKMVRLSSRCGGCRRRIEEEKTRQRTGGSGPRRSKAPSEDTICYPQMRIGYLPAPNLPTS
jgi:hypothetical protein